MRKFMINVNGSRYEVEVEEIAAGQSAPVMTAAPAAPVAAPIAAPAAPAAAPAAVPAAPAAVPAAGAAGRVGSEQIKAPMPGAILKVEVAVGQTVKKNQILCVLEAMKMENEIVSTRDGVVVGVHTTKGSSVNAGELLISLE